MSYPYHMSQQSDKSQISYLFPITDMSLLGKSEETGLRVPREWPCVPSNENYDYNSYYTCTMKVLQAIWFATKGHNHIVMSLYIHDLYSSHSHVASNGIYSVLPHRDISVTRCKWAIWLRYSFRVSSPYKSDLRYSIEKYGRNVHVKFTMTHNINTYI